MKKEEYIRAYRLEEEPMGLILFAALESNAIGSAKEIADLDIKRNGRGFEQNRH